jgi:hypothetical protein
MVRDAAARLLTMRPSNASRSHPESLTENGVSDLSGV